MSGRGRFEPFLELSNLTVFCASAAYRRRRLFLAGSLARLLPLALGLLVAALPEPSVAQVEYDQAPDFHTLEEVPALTPSRGGPLEIRLRSDTRFVVDSDFGASDATLYWPRGSVRVGVPLSERAAVRFRVNGGATVYDFDGTTNLFGLGPSSGDPFDGLYAGSIAAESVYRASETWAFFVQGFVDAQWEGGAAFDDSISGGGGLAVGYQIPDRFDLIVGVGLKSRLDRSGPRPYPLIDLEWTIDDTWRLRSHGQGLVLEYAINDAFKMFLRGRVETRRYRLDNRLGPANRGTVRDRQIPVGLGIHWMVNRNLRVVAIAGVMAYHQLKVRNRSRDTIRSISADPAPYFEVRINLRP